METKFCSNQKENIFFLLLTVFQKFLFLFLLFFLINVMASGGFYSFNFYITVHSP